MARRYAPVLCTIWDDPDFVALAPEAQRLYLLLLSQKKLTMVGVVPLAPRNWSRGCEATNPDDIEVALGRLVDARFVLVDYDTDELLVRTMLKHDPPKGPKSRAAMWRSLSTVDSERLRRECAKHIDDDTWDDEVAQPPTDLQYLRNAPSDPPPDGASDAGPDGARTHARAPSCLLPPATEPPSSDHRESTSSSVLTVVPNCGTDDDDFARTVELIVDAKERAYRPRNPKGWRGAVRRNTGSEDGELIRRMLADGSPPEVVALFVLGHGETSTQPPAHGAPAWDDCAETCDQCDGDSWIDTGNGLAPCPNRKASTA